jgi:hypothetical protein
MSIIFDATARRKPNTRRFAAGLLAFVPMTYVTSHTASDEAEYAQMSADREQARRDFDNAVEDRYAASLADDVVSSGYSWM